MEQLTLERSPMYLCWYDPSVKKTPQSKIQAACERFVEKFGKPPTTVLCNPYDAEGAGLMDGLTIEARSYVARNTFYVGGEE